MPTYLDFEKPIAELETRLTELRRSHPADGDGKKEPRKIANFRLRDASFENKKKYSEWQFIYAPTTAGALFPAVTPAPAR